MHDEAVLFGTQQALHMIFEGFQSNRSASALQAGLADLARFRSAVQAHRRTAGTMSKTTEVVASTAGVAEAAARLSGVSATLSRPHATSERPHMGASVSPGFGDGSWVGIGAQKPDGAGASRATTNTGVMDAGECPRAAEVGGATPPHVQSDMVQEPRHHINTIVNGDVEDVDVASTRHQQSDGRSDEPLGNIVYLFSEPLVSVTDTGELEVRA